MACFRLVQKKKQLRPYGGWPRRGYNLVCSLDPHMTPDYAIHIHRTMSAKWGPHPDAQLLLSVCGRGLGPSRGWVRHQSGVSSRSAHNAAILYRRNINHNVFLGIQDLSLSPLNSYLSCYRLSRNWCHHFLSSIVSQTLMPRPTSLY